MRGRAHPPARLLAVVVPVSLVGVTAYAVATVAFALDPGSATKVAGVGAFLVASTLAERFPVPVEGADANGVSLGFVFALAALVLFGWAPATFIYATAPTLVAIGRRACTTSSTVANLRRAAPSACAVCAVRPRNALGLILAVADSSSSHLQRGFA